MLAVAALAALAFTISPASSQARAKKRAPQPTAGFFTYLQGWNPVLSAADDAAAHNRIVILQGSAQAQRDMLRSAGGGARILLYKDAMETIAAPRPVPDTLLTTAVDYQMALTSHPEWFLRNRSGQPITRRYTPTETDYLMDVGSRTYQAQVVANILAQVRAGGWDGVFLDDVLPTARWWVPSQKPSTVAKYPTDKAYSKASRSFVKYVGTKLRAAGLMVIASTCCNQTYHQRADWSRFLDGTMDEGFLNPTADPTAPLAFDSKTAWNQWGGYLDEVKVAERTHKILLAETVGTAGNPARGRYALATVLLAARSQTLFEYHTSDTASTWTVDQQTALQLGAPKGAYKRLASGVYQRVFARGIVLVNPRPPGARRVKVKLGRRYSGSGLKHVSRVSLRSVSGLILLRDR